MHYPVTVMSAVFRREPLTRRSTRGVRDFMTRGGIAGVLFLLGNVWTLVTTRGRDPSQYAAIDLSALLSIIYACVSSTYCLWYSFRGSGRAVWAILLKTPMSCLTAYVFLCGVSSLWSNKPVYTAYRGFECFACLLLIVTVGLNLRHSCTDQELVNWIVLWGLWALVWDFATKARTIGMESLMSAGIFRLAYLSIGPLFFLAALASQKRLASIIIVLLSLLSGANTTYCAIFLGGVPALLMGNRKAWTTLPFVFGIATVAVLVFGGTQVIQHTLFHGREGVGLEYTSGRDKVWAYSIEQGMKHPFKGYGFVSGENDALTADAFRGAISTHNVFLSSFLAVGLAGPTLMACFFLLLLIKAARSPSLRWCRSAAVGSVIMILCISAANPGLGGRVYGSWVAVVLVSTFVVLAAYSPGGSR